MNKTQYNNAQDNIGEPVELFISCRGLKNLNNILVSDPQVYVYQKSGNQMKLVGHTEVQKKNLNPDFRTTVKMTYMFNQKQKLIFEIHDTNESLLGKVTELALTGDRKENFMGSTKKKLSELMGAQNCLSKLKIENGGMMMVFVDKLKDHGGEQITTINWQWGGKHLKNMDFFSKSDPFAKFFKYNQGNRLLVHQTEVIKDDLDPTWKPWEVTKDQLCPQNDCFYVEVWDYNRIGGHSFIGDADVSISAILDKDQHEFVLHDKKKKETGRLVIRNKQVSIPPPPVKREITFLDYLRGNWQLSLVIGIDFTFSNGPLYKPDSLHQLKEEEWNQYQKTIKDVGGAIVCFDFDKDVPVYGFGGVPKLPNYQKNYAEDCFPINGNKENPYCKDVAGILQAYEAAVPNIEFSGPTFIANILRKAHDYAVKNAAEDTYTVVIIMTDGQIEDMDEAMTVIADCSLLPMSIIIVGVGDENFSYMHTLDNTEQIRKHAKADLKDQVRDVTQFVAFKEYDNDSHKLMAKVLEEFPKQFMAFMIRNHRKPHEAVKVQLSKIEALTEAMQQ